MQPDVPLWRRPRARLFALTTLLWVLVLCVVTAARDVLLPFVIAGLAAYVIEPIIARLARVRVAGWPVPRWGAVLLVYVALALLAWGAAVSVIPQIYREAMRGLLELRDFLASITPERIDGWARDIDVFLERYGIPVEVVPGEPHGGGARLSVDLAAGIAEALRNASAGLRTHVVDVVKFSRTLLAGALAILVFILLLFMITAFVSMDAPRIIRYFESLLPSEWREDFRRLLHGIDAGLAGVVRGQLTIMLVNGTLTLVGLLVLRIPFAFALAALATLLYIVPIFGTILSSIPIVLLALAAGGLGKGVLALGWILAIHALETYFMNPKIMGNAARIHPVLIVLALLVGERTLGLVGALLAVPVASVFIAVFRFLHRKLAELDAQAAATADGGAPPAAAAAERLPQKGSSP